MNVCWSLLMICLVNGLDFDGHQSFGEHFANGVSTMIYYNNRQGGSNKLYFVMRKFISDLKSAFDECIDVANKFDNDEALQLCYSAIFNDDYFWS